MRIVVTNEQAGERLDHVVAASLALSHARARRLFVERRVRIEGRLADKGERAPLGAVLEVTTGELDLAAKPDPALALAIVFEDATFVILDKPVGVPSHPLAPGEVGCVANALVARYPEMRHVGYDARQPGLVNRLDNDTSGLLIAARSGEAFERLRQELAAGRVHKRYLALTTRPAPLGPIDVRLLSRGARVVVDREGQPAHSDVVSCTPRPDGRFLVEVEAAHAFRHQVRAHLAHVGAPLFGDALYGGEPAAHHHLHASRVAFTHPFTGERVDIASPSPWPATL